MIRAVMLLGFVATGSSRPCQSCNTRYKTRYKSQGQPSRIQLTNVATFRRTIRRSQDEAGLKQHGD